MKKTALVSLIFILVVSLMLTACGGTKSVWENATYTENTELGEGATTFYLDVKAEDKTVTLTLNTDKTNLADALTELGLVSGEDGAFGLYVKTVNGILADYDIDGYYWGFNKNGESMLVGVSGETIEAGAHYELVRTK